MTPEAARFLEKAGGLLDQAETMIGVGLTEAAGRNAYLAGYHAAQALLFERPGKMLTTHRGVQTEFLRLTRDDPSFPEPLRLFLSRAYDLKAIADYKQAPMRNHAAARHGSRGHQPPLRRGHCHLVSA